MARESLVALYGRDHGVYGHTHVASLADGRTAVAISVGADRKSPSHRFKADADVPNEDALLAIDTGAACLLAVADAHFGSSASHELIASLAAVPRMPATLRTLRDLIDECARPRAAGRHDRSESTLLVAVYERATARGFGFSIGDSSFAVLRPSGTLTVLTEKAGRYVRPGGTEPITRLAEPFEFSATPGDLLLAFTDGVDECHYHSRATSLQPRHFSMVLARSGPHAASFAHALVDLALTGVDGNPGGQDNVALVVSLA